MGAPRDVDLEGYVPSLEGNTRERHRIDSGPLVQLHVRIPKDLGHDLELAARARAARLGFKTVSRKELIIRGLVLACKEEARKEPRLTFIFQPAT